MNKTKLSTILRNNKCIDLLDEQSSTECRIISALLQDDFDSHYQNLLALVEDTEYSDLKAKLYEYAAHNKADKLLKARKTEKLARSEAAECEYIAMTCDNIIKLLTEQQGCYSTEDENEFMHNYIADIAKFDTNIANAIQTAYDDEHKQYAYVCYLCEYQSNTLHALADIVLHDSNEKHTNDKVNISQVFDVNELRNDEFYGKLF